MSQQINLLEPSLRPVRQWCRGRDLLLGGGTLAALVLAHYQFERLALARLLAASVAAPADGAEAAADAPLQERQARLQRDEMLLKTVAGLTDLPHESAQRVQRLVAALPPKVWLKAVELSGARGLRVSGGALEAAGVAEFVRRLGDEPAFKGLPLQVFVLEAGAADAKAPGTPEGVPPVFHGFVLSSLDPVAKEAR